MFDELYSTLQKHLPPDTADTPVEIETDGITVFPPGIDLGDVASFLTDLTGLEAFLPSDMGLEGVRIAYLSLKRSGGTTSCDLTLTVASELKLPGGLIAKLERLELEYEGGAFSGKAETEIDYEDLALKATIEFPSLYVEADLAPIVPDANGALPPRHEGGLLSSIGMTDDEGDPKLQSLRLAASVPAKTAEIQLELQHLFHIGSDPANPLLSLDYIFAQLSVSAKDGGRGAVAARLSADLGHTGGQRTLVDVSGVVDKHGFSLQGSIDFAQNARPTIARLVDGAAKAIGADAPDIPPSIGDLGLKHLGLSLDTDDKSFGFDCILNTNDADTELSLRVEKSQETLVVTGALTVHGQVVTIAFVKGADPVVLAAYDAGAKAPLTLEALVKGIPLLDNTPAATISDVLKGEIRVLLAAKDANGTVASADLEAGVDLSGLGKLPLLGPMLSKMGHFGVNFRPTYVSNGFKAGETLAPYLPPALSDLDTSVPTKSLGVSLELGDTPFALDDPGDEKELKQNASKPANAAAPDAASTKSPPKGIALDWKDIDKHIGPLHIGRVGYGMGKTASGNREFELAVDSSVSLAGIAVSVMGMGASYDLDDHKLTPHLHGLGLDIERGPLKIEGGFINQDGNFAGKISIAAPSFALNALGGFTMLDGVPSMFIFGSLIMPIGGPPVFFVEGLSAGFGVHRDIIQPTISHVSDFPLVASAMGSGGGGLDKELEALLTYIPPKRNAYFLAFGVKFSSFKMVDGALVLILTLADDIAIDLLGTANMSLPPQLPPGTPALAFIELNLHAHVGVTKGIVSVEAEITPKTYVFGPPGHLTGGFAFFTWLKDQPGGISAGDFVLSIGGYHPEWQKPAHYPIVAPVELKFCPDEDVSLKGSAYFALTPSCLMAGGLLDASVKAGGCEAEARISADFMVGWKPFHYDAKIAADITATYAGFHKHLSAQLHMWGPELSGVACIDFGYFGSFDVEFGAGANVEADAIDADEFKSSFLGLQTGVKSDSSMLGLVAVNGLIQDASHDDSILGVFNPTDIELTLSTPIPIAKISGAASWRTGEKLGLCPMGEGTIGASELTVAIQRDGQTVKDLKCDPQMTSFPSAIWGQAHGGRPKLADNAPQMVKTAGGLRLRPKNPPVPGAGQPVAVHDLRDAIPPALSMSAKGADTSQNAGTTLEALGLTLSQPDVFSDIHRRRTGQMVQKLLEVV